MAKPTNVVVFFTDQQRWDTLGTAGNPDNLTPNLDMAAQHGAFFEIPITPQPLCTPARSCLQTGRFATSTGVYRNGIPLGDEPDSLARVFTQAGYDTGYIGKWHLADEASKGAVRKEQRAGYDYWFASNLLELTSDAYDTSLWNADGTEVRLPGYRVDAVTDQAIDYIHAHRDSDRPFFLFVSLLEPHHQNSRDDYPAPLVERGSQKSAWMPPDLAALGGNAHRQIDGYYGMIRRIDQAYGRLCDALHSLGLDEETLIVFTSDHGNHFRTRNGEYKRSVHEASVKVPLVITGPGVPEGRRVREVVSTLDLLPTMLELCGIEVPASYQGRSLVPLLQSLGDDWSDQAFIQVSEAEVARGLRTRRWKYGVHAPDADPYHDSCSDTYTEAWLYDLESDPYELRNLVSHPDYKGEREHLRQMLGDWCVYAGEPRPTITSA